jgi:glucose-6-phosphate isomerase
MCGYLMQVCPFDQPDVASAKARVLEILDAGLPEPDFTGGYLGDVIMGTAKVHVSECCADAKDVRGALKALFASMKPHDYFALNAFLPFTGAGRREALEAIRFCVAERSGAVACLEVGPRFLHSTGQLQKGGPNTGVFLVLSAEEQDDVALTDQPAKSLGELAEAQATGDALTLAERGRRCLHLHLPNNSAATLRQLAIVVEDVLEEIERERAQQA